MKRLLFSLGVILLFGAAGCALLMKDNNLQSYYTHSQELPLNVGNYWAYRVIRYDGFNPNDIMTATLTMTDTIANVEIQNEFFVATVQSERSTETLVEVRGSYPVTDSLQPATTQTYWLIVDNNRVLRQDDKLDFSDLESRVSVEFVFPLERNNEWSMFNTKDAPLNREIIKVGSITVPAGTFTDCFYIGGDAYAGTTFEKWFCPGIGIVWENFIHHGTPYGSKRELIRYSVK